MTSPPLTRGQKLALDQLRSMAADTRALQLRSVEVYPDHVAVDVSVDCSNLKAVDGGIRFRRRERLVLCIPPRFPFEIPSVMTRHDRWAGAPHVQWRRVLCLYQSPSVEWNPADGIAGYVERLMLWLERAAAGQLDAAGAPLHPPVAYTSAEAGAIVVRADAPVADEDRPWVGAALLRRVDKDRADLIGWLPLGEAWPTTQDQARETAALGDDDAVMELALAVVLPEPIAFEYPDTASVLMQHLATHGLHTDILFGCLGAVAVTNLSLSKSSDFGNTPSSMPPLHIVVGTPSRGIAGEAKRLTHLAVWRLPPLGEDIARLSAYRFSSHPELAAMGRRVIEIGQKWLETEKTAWAHVYEMRPEIVTRRDASTPAAWLAHRSILILGAGALGAPIAEACVRGGARRVCVADRGAVHPGILVRQPYYDEEIGEPKAKVLAERLARITPETQVDYWCADVGARLADTLQPPPGYDLIIDATADRTVRTVLERCRAERRDTWPAVATVLIGHDATRGIATLSYPGASGGGADILRRLGTAARADATGTLGDLIDDFFPDPPPEHLFQPEPGCSDATFVGSASQVAGLAGQLLHGILAALSSSKRNAAMLALITRMPMAPGVASAASPTWLHWPNDTVIRSADGRHEVRLAPRAEAEMRAEARRGARVRGPRVETGGCLLGSFDTAADIVWVDEATGPPPDSVLSETHFQHGTQGVGALLAARRAATARVTAFVGLWHTHPYGPAAPSPTDERGMRGLVLPVASAPPHALMLIIGGVSEHWRSWLAGHGAPSIYGRVVERTAEPTRGRDVQQTAQSRNEIGPSQWPGGYALPAGVLSMRNKSRRSRWRTPWKRAGK